MNPFTISFLAKLFSAVGAIVGIPSITVLVFYTFHQLTKPAGNASAATNFGSHPDAILLMLKGITQVMGALAGVVSSATQFLFNALAVLAAVSLMLAIACWFTGRGLGAQAAWARFSAGALLSLVFLPTLLLALSLNGIGRLAMLALSAMCLCALHAVWVGYGGQTA